jgi:hypothetical protein
MRNAFDFLNPSFDDLALRKAALRTFFIGDDWFRCIHATTLTRNKKLRQAGAIFGRVVAIRLSSKTFVLKADTPNNPPPVESATYKSPTNQATINS